MKNVDILFVEVKEMIVNKINAEIKLSALGGFQSANSSVGNVTNAFIPDFGETLKKQNEMFVNRDKNLEVKKESREGRRDVKEPTTNFKDRRVDSTQKPKEVEKTQDIDRAKDTEEAVVDENKPKKDDEVLEVLAEMLGINLEVLQQIVDNNTKIATDSKTNASEEQTQVKMLSEIINALKEELQELLKQNKVEGNQWNSQLKEKIDAIMNQPEFKEVFEKWELKLNESGKALKDELMNSEVNKAQEANTKKEEVIPQENKVDTKIDSAVAKKTDGKAEESNKGDNLAKVTSSEQKGSEQKSSEGFTNSFASFGAKMQDRQVTGVKVGGNAPEFVNSIEQANSKISSQSFMKVERPMPINRQEIIQQIIDKVKVNFSPDKNEMIVQLKPDHLGKISLQVVSERGSVIAKMVAENDQVKAIIESNMQSLKDSLQQQGVSVQKFEVSVGQEHKGWNFNGGQGERNGRNQSGSLGNRKINMVGVEGDMPVRRAINPYEMSESRINLTA